MGWLKIRMPGGRWASISRDTGGPDGTGLLKLRQPDGTWMRHVNALETTGSKMLRLQYGGWEPVLAMGADADFAMVLDSCTGFGSGVMLGTPPYTSGTWGAGPQLLAQAEESVGTSSFIQSPVALFDFWIIQNIVREYFPNRTVTDARMKWWGFMRIWTSTRSATDNTNAGPEFEFINDPDFHTDRYNVNFWELNPGDFRINTWERWPDDHHWYGLIPDNLGDGWRPSPTNPIDPDEKLRYYMLPWQTAYTRSWRSIDSFYDWVPNVNTSYWDPYPVPNRRPVSLGRGKVVWKRNMGGTPPRGIHYPKAPNLTYWGQGHPPPYSKPFYQRNFTGDEFWNQNFLAYGVSLDRLDPPPGPWTAPALAGKARVRHFEALAESTIEVYLK